MKSDNSELLEYLDEIAERSSSGVIEWTQPNPSTFTWSERDFLVTLQKASTPKIKTQTLRMEMTEEISYLFTVLEKSSRQTVVSFSTKDRPDLFERLDKIYRGAEVGIDSRSTNVLRKLLWR